MGLLLFDIRRVPECLSSRLNWVPPPPPRMRVWLPPHLVLEGEPHPLAGKEVGGPNSDDWTDTLVLYIEIPLRGEV
jgi:hypothetical protein